MKTHFLFANVCTSILVLKYPVLVLPAFEFQFFHFCCFYLFTSSTWAFLNANFSAFILVFLLFFTFSGSLGKILSFYGILNSVMSSNSTSYFFYYLFMMGLSLCSSTTSWELYFLYLTWYPSSSIFSMTQG